MAGVGPSTRLRDEFPRRLSYEAEERLAIVGECAFEEPAPTAQVSARAVDARRIAEPAGVSPMECAPPRLLGGKRFDTSEIFAPLPPMKWIVLGMQLGAGRPSMLLGYGGSGKTIAAQSLALSVATGRPVWGEFALSGGGRRVLHLDFDQGSHATRRRYQRLAIGLGIDPSELGERLVVEAAPTVYLSSSGAVDAYAQAAEGFDLVIIDALRGATPGIDENDSKIRECIDVARHLSERTGAAVLLLHHTGKKDLAEVNARTAGRGSSAIFDGCGTVFAMAGEPREAVRLIHTKAAAEAEGALMEDFYLVIADVPQGDDPKAGVIVSHRSAGGVKPTTMPLDGMRVRVLDGVRVNPGVNGKQAVANAIGTDGRSYGLVSAAVDSLLADGSIVNQGPKNRPRYYLPGEIPRG